MTLTNFALSKHLVRSNDKLTDQRGSLAYVSPDVLSGKCVTYACGVFREVNSDSIVGTVLSGLNREVVSLGRSIVIAL